MNNEEHVYIIELHTQRFGFIDESPEKALKRFKEAVAMGVYDKQINITKEEHETPLSSN